MKEDLKSILIVKLSAIGDVVHTLPLLEVLRKNFPKGRIDWLVEEEAGQIIEGHQGIDHVIISRRKSWQRRFFKPGEQARILRETFQFLQTLRQCEYDIVIDLQGLFKSGLLTGLSRGKRKMGFTGGREGSSLFLTERPHPVDYDQHALERYLKTADILKCPVDSWQGDIPLREVDKRSIDAYFESEGIDDIPVVAVNPMARWRTKLWDIEKFAALADRIQRELSCRIIFTGSVQDRAIIDAIIHRMKGRPLNLTGRTNLKELAYLYSKSTLSISTDTGPMHIAAAMGCPVVAIFGPTAPSRTGPYGQGHIVIRSNLECSPCFQKTCSHMTCMNHITVDKVFDAVYKIYNQ